MSRKPPRSSRRKKDIEDQALESGPPCPGDVPEQVAPVDAPDDSDVVLSEHSQNSDSSERSLASEAIPARLRSRGRSTKLSAHPPSFPEDSGEDPGSTQVRGEGPIPVNPASSSPVSREDMMWQMLCNLSSEVSAMRQERLSSSPGVKVSPPEGTPGVSKTRSSKSSSHRKSWEPVQRNLDKEEEDWENLQRSKQFHSYDLETPRLDHRSKKPAPSSRTRRMSLHDKLYGPSILEGSDPSNPSDPSDSSDSDSSVESIDNRKKLKKKSRFSILPPRTRSKAVDQPLASAIHGGILRTGASEDSSHIVLKSFTTAALFAFLHKLDLYYHRNDIMLPASSRVADHVVQRVLACVDVPISDPSEFLQLDRPTMVRYFRRALRPRTLEKFAAALVESTPFPSEHAYDLNAESFERFLADLHTYGRLFNKVFLFLSHCNSECIPTVENKKPYGLIHLYLSNIPHKAFVEKVMYDLRTNRAESIRFFIEEIWMPKMFSIQKDLNHFLKVKSFLRPSTRSDSEPSKKHSSSSSNPSNPIPKKKFHYFPRRSVSPVHGRSSLNAVAIEAQGSYAEDTIQEDRVSSEEYDVYEDRVPKNFARASSLSDDDEDVPMKSVPAQDLDLDEISNEVLNHVAGSTNPSSGPSRGPGRLYDPKSRSLGDNKNTGVCYTKLTQGSCSKPNCSFVHSVEAIQKELLRLHGTWGKPGSTPPPRDFAPKRPPPEPPPEPYEEMPCGRIPVPILDRVSSHLHNLLSSTEKVVQAVFHQGSINLPGSKSGKETKLFFSALLDSGALHSSYMSKNYHRLHWNVLEPFTERCEALVTMADNLTTARIRNRVSLEVTILGPSGEAFTFRDSYAVIDCAHDLIIGLPSIVNNVLPLFTESLFLAQKNTQKPSELNVMIDNPWSFIDEIAPEDSAPIPCSFSEPIHYLSISHDQAVEQYLQLLESHVDKEFATKTPILGFLTSEIGIRAFVPKNWEGVRMQPVTLKYKETMPTTFKPPARNVNPKIWDVAKKEFERLMTYFYVKSDSPRVSPIVIAPKATEPFIRFAGDYSIWVNKHMLTGHWPIPNVRHSLEKIQRFSYFADIDLTNGFHQIPISEETSNLLSVQTPWGTVRPLFLPEGVPQGSGLLQEIMMDIFEEFQEWTIVIFDNLLVLATSLDDMYEKVKVILSRAVERNLVFKMKKTWLGVSQVTFFGYVCSQHTYRLSEERLKGITDMQMPNSKKSVKRFLGSSGFFIPFVPNYSTLVAPLHDMSKDSFNWNSKTWQQDYVKVFENFKEALKRAATLYYPDYDLEWILRADASELGVGIVLFQIFIAEDGSKVNQPLLFASKKFSEQAKKWSTYAQEAFAMYFGFKTCEYYIRGKHFTYEGDHANLQWMERSTEAKVIRQRLYMQGFPFKFNHIPGMQNSVADWQSRFEELRETLSWEVIPEVQYNVSDQLWQVCGLRQTLSKVPPVRPITRTFAKNMPQDLLEQKPPDPVLGQIDPSDSKEGPYPGTSSEAPTRTSETNNLTRLDMLREAHASRAGHLGVRRTYDTLNLRFPGHGIPLSQVTAFKESCPVCQKTEDYMSSQLVPIVRHLKTLNPGSVVGIDFLSVILDKFGNSGCYVLRDHHTKLVFIYPVPSHDAENAALAIFSYCVTYGGCDILMSDPGSDLTSQAVSQVNQWFGIHHKLSLVDRHESNGVEGANKQILRHLTTLFMLERVKDRWSSPHVIGWASFLMNRFDQSESGYSPYDLTFGTISHRRFDFPTSEFKTEQVHKYVRMLNDSLKTLSAAAGRFQMSLAQKRTSKNLPQNLFQEGDMVMFRLPRDKPKPHKLHPVYLGPYEVLVQTKNDVQVRHVATHKIYTFYVGDLKAFFGSASDARNLAAVDADQYLVHSVLAYRGDPLQRAGMYFLVRFLDEDKLWVPWSLDLQDSEPYHVFCASLPELYPLRLTSRLLLTWLRDTRKKVISLVRPNQQVLIDLRAFGSDWYASLTLPDKDLHTYLTPCTYGQVTPNKRSINLASSILDLRVVVDNVFITLYGNNPLPRNGHSIVDQHLLAGHPSLLTFKKPSVKRVEDFHYLVGQEFYDKDARSSFVVTRIDTTRTRDIVAFVKRRRPDGTLTREELSPYHVADVIQLVPARK